MGAMSRRKGAVFERQMANVFAILFPDAKRGIGQSRWGGEVPDVDGTPFWPECKRGNSTTAAAALKQATEAKAKSTGRGPALAVVRRDRERIIASMYLEDFLILLAGHVVTDETERALVVEKVKAAVLEVEGVTASGKKPSPRKGKPPTP